MTTTATKFTPQQQAAIDTRQVSVALSAGAGCGKTFVLTERFLSHLEPGRDETALFDTLESGNTRGSSRLHELVAITFTDRAAREMRDRIRKKCYERLKSAPANQVDHWLRLLRSLDSARVSTIHAFCGALLRSHAVEAQLDPRFVVIEQSQADTLLAEIIEDVLRENLADQQPAALELTTQFGIDRLQEMIGGVLGKGRIDFDNWLPRKPEELVEIWQRFHKQHVVPAVLQQIVESSAAQKLLEFLANLDPVPNTLTDARNLLLSDLPLLADAKKPAAKLAELREAAKVPKGGKKVWGDENQSDQFRDSAKAFRDFVDKKRDCLDFDPEAALADAVAGLQLLALAKSVFDRYEARKRELAWLDFNDLLVRSRDLLVDPAHAEMQQRLAAQIRLLLVDECQDTDPVQVDLIKALCGQNLQNGKLFFVGDYKQSIYRFRGADPKVFHGLQQSTPKEGRLPLAQNFRSQPAVLEFVNALFCDALSGDAQTGESDDKSRNYEPLKPTRPQVDRAARSRIPVGN